MTIATPHVAVRRPVPVAVATLTIALHGRRTRTESASATKALRSAWIGLSDGEIGSLTGGRHLTFVLGELCTNEAPVKWTFFNRSIAVG